MPDIDLEKPGKLTASGLNALNYMFLIFKDQPQYTKDSLAANPDSVNAADLLLKSPLIPDAAGNVAWDISPFAKDLKAKMDSPFMSIKVAVVGHSKPTNQDPMKRLADLQSFQLLKGTPKLVMGATKPEVAVGGTITLAVDFQFLDTVTLTAAPADVLHLSKTSLVKSDTLTVTGLKDGKATITASGTGADGNLTEKTDITAVGFSVQLPGIGYKAP